MYFKNEKHKNDIIKDLKYFDKLMRLEIILKNQKKI
jgi:hypothetical protein